MAPAHVSGVRLERFLHLFRQQVAICVLQGSFQWVEFVIRVLLENTLRVGEHLNVECVKLEHSPHHMGP